MNDIAWTLLGVIIGILLSVLSVVLWMYVEELRNYRSQVKFLRDFTNAGNKGD